MTVRLRRRRLLGLTGALAATACFPAVPTTRATPSPPAPEIAQMSIDERVGTRRSATASSRASSIPR